MPKGRRCFRTKSCISLAFLEEYTSLADFPWRGSHPPARACSSVSLPWSGFALSVFLAACRTSGSMPEEVGFDIRLFQISMILAGSAMTKNTVNGIYSWILMVTTCTSIIFVVISGNLKYMDIFTIQCYNIQRVTHGYRGLPEATQQQKTKKGAVPGWSGSSGGSASKASWRRWWTPASLSISSSATSSSTSSKSTSSSSIWTGLEVRTGSPISAPATAPPNLNDCRDALLHFLVFFRWILKDLWKTKPEIIRYSPTRTKTLITTDYWS